MLIFKGGEDKGSSREKKQKRKQERRHGRGKSSEQTRTAPKISNHH